MIRLADVSLSFGVQNIFNKISWHIRPAERIALVGPNGAGKSTLLRVILGEQQLDSGKMLVAKKITFGYLPQEAIQYKSKTLIEETLSAFQSILELDTEIHHLQVQVEMAAKAGVVPPLLLRQLGQAQHQFEQANGYRIEYEAKRILAGLGFGEDDWQRPTTTFSGGWQMRIALAKLLLQRPNLLMLDEPTNHLDVQTTEWLENYLQSYEGAYILVSHDRYFLDRTVKKIAALDRGKLQIYTGNYSFYEQERERQIEAIWQQYLRQQEEIERLQKFIDRFRYKATKAAQVQSRIKMLEKIDRIVPPAEVSQVRFHFPLALPSGRLLLELQGVAKSYNGKPVFAGVSFRCDRGERIALVGVNGAGKSSLCRILAGSEAPDAGKIFRDEGIRIGYYAPEIADNLDSQATVLAEAQIQAVALPPVQLRNILGAFLFRGDEVNKTVQVLSGGEKSRLALACLLFQSANLLILDEPTNHLDLASKNVLQEALQAFIGSIILVSHDRYFLDKIVHRIVEVADGTVQQYWGNYSDYLAKKQVESSTPTNLAKMEIAAKSDAENEQTADTPRRKSREQKRLEAEERNLRSSQRRKHEQKLIHLEAEIEQNEKRKQSLEAEMTDPATFQQGERVRHIQMEYHQINHNLKRLYRDWEVIAEKIEKINLGIELA